MSHHGAQYYLYVRWVEQPLSRCGVDRNLSLPSTVANPDSSETFFISSTFSVFNIKFIQSVFWISKIECIFAVKCCELVFFLYIRHEFDTAINAIFIKNFSKDFPYLFVRRRATTTELFFFFCFSIITFFQCCGIFNFWILPSLLRHSQFKGFFNICKWSKNACPTFLKKICILRVWM